MPVFPPYSALCQGSPCFKICREENQNVKYICPQIGNFIYLSIGTGAKISSFLDDMKASSCSLHRVDQQVLPVQLLMLIAKGLHLLNFVKNGQTPTPCHEHEHKLGKTLIRD